MGQSVVHRDAAVAPNRPCWVRSQPIDVPHHWASGFDKRKVRSGFQRGKNDWRVDELGTHARANGDRIVLDPATFRSPASFPAQCANLRHLALLRTSLNC
jgi:hypothetical protein